MTNKLRECPCGKTPESLGITMSNTSKYAYVSGTCCSEWSIEFRTDYNAHYTAKCEQLAIEAWNAAPRKNMAKDLQTHKQVADRALSIVDTCFHAFAADFRGDAMDMAKKLLNKEIEKNK